MIITKFKIQRAYNLKIFLRCERSISFRKATEWYRQFWSPRRVEPPYNHVVQIGDPVLRLKSKNIHPSLIKTEEMSLLVNNLKHVMKRYNCVGLSAPQIGIPIRVFVIRVDINAHKEITKEIYQSTKLETIPFTVFINPEIKVLDYKKVSYPEACESIRGFAAEVPRFLEIECTGLDSVGEEIKFQTKGWVSRIIQHELNHLDGILYTDIMNRQTLECTCWQAVNSYEGRINIPFYPK